MTACIMHADVCRAAVTVNDLALEIGDIKNFM